MGENGRRRDGTRRLQTIGDCEGGADAMLRIGGR